MDLLIAIGHIAGSLVMLLVLGFVTALIGSWEVERNSKRFQEEISIELGIPVDKLGEEAALPQVVRHSSERFSNELLRNRLSDLCGVVRTAWGWVGSIVQVCVLSGTVWYAFTDDLEIAAYAWFMLPIALFFYIVSVVFSFLCVLLTGRFPGQAKLARKSLAQCIKQPQP